MNLFFLVAVIAAVFQAEYFLSQEVNDFNLLRSAKGESHFFFRLVTRVAFGASPNRNDSIASLVSFALALLPLFRTLQCGLKLARMGMH